MRNFLGIIWVAVIVNYSTVRLTASASKEKHLTHQIKKINRAKELLRHQYSLRKQHKLFRDGSMYVGLPDTQKQLNTYLENTSPEYNYEKVGKNVEARGGKLKHGLHPMKTSAGIHGTSAYKAPSLEELNFMLQATLPEYRYDDRFKGKGRLLNPCEDLDPDCHQFEIDGLCSDNPDFALKRFNCKKTCHLCKPGLLGMKRKQNGHSKQ